MVVFELVATWRCVSARVIYLEARGPAWRLGDQKSPGGFRASTLVPPFHPNCYLIAETWQWRQPRRSSGHSSRRSADSFQTGFAPRSRPRGKVPSRNEIVSRDAVRIAGSKYFNASGGRAGKIAKRDAMPRDEEEARSLLEKSEPAARRRHVCDSLPSLPLRKLCHKVISARRAEFNFITEPTVIIRSTHYWELFKFVYRESWASQGFRN